MCLNIGMTKVLSTINGTVINWDGKKISYVAGLAIDGDGSPRCYGPNNSGLDYTANGGKPGDWWGVVVDGIGNPIIQGKNDPAPGMYISTTSLVLEGYGPKDPRRYVNSETVPYVVVPNSVRKAVPGKVLGCKVTVTNTKTGKSVEAVVADIGPGNKIGEGSIALAKALGINENVRKGGTSDRIIKYEIFPGNMYVWK